MTSIRQFFNCRRILRVGMLFFIALVGGAVSAWAQTCPGQASDGANFQCFNSGDCGGGYVYCVTEQCTFTLNCDPDQFHQGAQGCAFGGCFNPFSINCSGC
jgi:hypothetical protein